MLPGQRSAFTGVVSAGCPIQPDNLFSMRRGALGAIAGIAALLLVLPSIAQSAEPSHAKSGRTIIPPYRGLSFDLHGTHGYEVAVRTKGPDRLVVEVSSRGTFAEYTVPAHNKDRRIEAKLGGLGAIAMRFDPAGPIEKSTEPQGDCKGRRERFQKGTFHGRFRFRGERGFTTGRVKRASGLFSHSFREVCKGKNAGRNGNPALEPTLIARSHGSDRTIAVEVFLEEGSAVSYWATIVESRLGLRIERTIITGAESATYVPGAAGEVTMTPPAPFSGAVEYRPNDPAGHVWQGTLSALFPGLGPVPLAGTRFGVVRRGS
jgi:hypothetical protein